MYISYGLEGLPDEEEMLLGAADGMVAASGDKYAKYYTAEDFQAYKEEQSGHYVGIGVTVQQDPETGGVMVTHVIKGSPAEESGILVGDIFVTVEDQDVSQSDITALSEMVRGDVDTEVRLSMKHRDGTVEDMSITRRPVVEDRVNSKMVTENIGYVQITQFAGNAADQFMLQVKELVRLGAKGIVLDLRNNPGGDKEIVCAIADALFPAGPIIICEDRNGNRTVDSSDSSCLNIPLVVLANEYSASASELLIGGIQDYQVGTFIGTNTYGKGVVQTFHYMPDGSSMMKLTTHRYLTPNERSIQDVGCTPDIVCEPSEELADNLMLMGTEKDNQLNKALEVLGEKIK
jgi:carboxyl-terminal processing protease